MKTISLIFIFALVLSLLPGCSPRKLEHKPFTMDEMMIEVFDTTREVAYTNKQSGFFYTETNAPHRTSWQGWHIMATKMMDDYQIAINGKPLDRKEVQIAQVYPHQFVRNYKTGVRERVTLLDSVDAIVVELERIKGSRLSVVPVMNQPGSDYQIIGSNNGLLISTKRHQQRTPKENFPVWVSVSFAGGLVKTDTGAIQLGALTGAGRLDADLPEDHVVIIFSAGDTQQQALDLAANVSKNYPALIAQRKERMEKVLNDSYLRTNDERLTKALNWSKLSIDALIMHQMKKGIFAGLPWFDDYWGRDSYISLPGAAIVTGDFKEAKEIIRSFADWQDRDISSPTAGRIPNLVTTNSTAYNTTDGTPWFTIALDMYLKYSNDTAFVREMYPTIFMAIEGALAHHTDSLSFMTHGDAETWMDAVGPNGPWSPRGNRANDIQALWYRQMQIAIGMAILSGDDQSAGRWNGIIHNIKLSFNRYFVDEKNGMVYDHLNLDGTPDTQVRPNQIFTLPLIQNAELRARVFRNVTEKLVYPWGVASLSQEDENFHPYHHYAPYYVQDAAYHNGIVWTWLAGRWIDAATEYHQQNLAYQVTENMAHQILDRGAVGTLSELTDALPRPNTKEPQLSGTFSQAWSLAEYLRSFYQSYLGCTVDATVPRIYMVPRLPDAITDVQFSVPVNMYKIDVEYHIDHGKGEVVLISPKEAKDLDIRFQWPMGDGGDRISTVPLAAGQTVRLQIDGNEIKEIRTEGTTVLNSGIRIEPLAGDPFAGMKLATPALKPDLKALRGPDYRLLRAEDIKATPHAPQTVFDASDPAGDDKGTGAYIYPKNPNLKPGSLDLTHCTVSADDKNVFFTLTFANLSNPGWHPEYGFQLTYATIAIDKDGKPGSGGTDIGMNSLYRLDPAHAYEDIIYVGGGLRVADAKGKTLAEYLPAPEDVKNPLGDIVKKTITFSIPIDIIGKPEPAWHVAVLIGAQDDHGGAGVGDFRAVAKDAGEWIGGGKKKPDDPNVYDVLKSW